MNLEPKDPVITATMLSLKGDVPANNSDHAAIKRNLDKNFFFKNTKREVAQKLK